MINLGSLAGLHRQKHQLAAYCQRCARWAEIDLAAMVAAGQGAPNNSMKVPPRERKEAATAQ